MVEIPHRRRTPIRHRVSSLARYGIAILTVAVALAFALVLRLRLDPAVSSPFLAAVTVSALYGGVGPALLATALSIAVSHYFFFAPLYDLAFDETGLFKLIMVRIAIFLVTALLITLVAAARKRAEDERARLFELEQAARFEAEEARRDAEAARADAEQANRAKDQFLATLSHELRSPLSAVLTWAQLLRRGILDAVKTRRALDTIEHSTKLQVRLIEDLLDISRIDSGKLTVEMETIDVAAVLRTAIESTQATADAKRIGLRLDAGPGVAAARGDPARLQQVFGNILANAVKFTPEDGSVTTVLRRAGAMWEITIRDTGIGIAPDELPHVFDRFHQADTSTTRRHRGLGLGLAIARHLVTLHDGEITAESGGENAGSAFRITLPAPVAAATAARTEHADQALGAGNGGRFANLGDTRILVVDDEGDTRESVVAVLAHCGASVRSAASVAEAIGELRHGLPDVVITDIAMPAEDGFALLSRVRTLDAELDGRHTPVVALTALAGADDRHRILGAGFDGHVAKPIDPSALATIVADTLRHARVALRATARRGV